MNSSQPRLHDFDNALQQIQSQCRVCAAQGPFAFALHCQLSIISRIPIYFQLHAYESRSKLPFTSFSLGSSCCAKIPKIDRGRPKTIGLFHFKLGLREDAQNVEIDRGCPNSKTKREQTSNFDAASYEEFNFGEHMRLGQTSWNSKELPRRLRLSAFSASVGWRPLGVQSGQLLDCSDGGSILTNHAAINSLLPVLL